MFEHREHTTILRLAAFLGVVSGLGVTTINCVRTAKGHCLYQGGDAWCKQEERGSACFVLVDGEVDLLPTDGCYDAVSTELDRQVHVEYGLPTAVFNANAGREPGLENFATLEGLAAVLVEQDVLEAGCDVDLMDLQPQVEQATRLREELEPPNTETNRSPAYLTTTQRTLFMAMNEAIGARFEPCLVADGTDTDETDTDETDTDGTITNGETETTGEDTTTGPMPCTRDGDCTNPAVPYCDPVDMTCVDCSGVADPDAACMGTDPNRPLCVGGACVVCTENDATVCDGQLLVCDTEAMECVPCTAHEQCEARACDLLAETPTCFDPDQVRRVGSGQDDLDVTGALMTVQSMGWTRAVLVLHEGGDINDAATVSAGAVALIAAPGQSPQWINTEAMNESTLSVSGADTRVYLDALRLSTGSGAGLFCDGAEVDVQRSQIVNNDGGGISAMSGCEVFVENSFIGGSDNSAALNVNSSSADVVYSTLGGGTINAWGLLCASPIAVGVRNSIIVALGNSITGGEDVICPSAMLTDTATETAFMGMGNEMVGELDLMNPEDWFVNYSIGDFSLQNDGLVLFDGVAEWREGDPPADIDGDLRPMVEGVPDYAGADVP